MKLSFKEKAIISACSLDAELSATSIAKKLGIKDNQVRYVIDKYLERGLLSTYTFLNVTGLGLGRFQVRFSIKPRTKRQEGLFLNYIKSRPEVSWLSELGGDFQFVCAIYARSTKGVLSFFEELPSSLQEIVNQKEISLINEQYHFGAKYLAPHVGKPIKLSSQEELVDFEYVDLEILDHLRSNPFSSWSALGKDIGIPPSSLSERVKRLKQKGLIVRIGYLLNEELLQREQYRLYLTVSGYNGELNQRILRFCRNHPQIVSLIHVIGGLDYELRVQVESGRETTELRHLICEKFSSNVYNLTVVPQFRTFQIYPASFFETLRRR